MPIRFAITRRGFCSTAATRNAFPIPNRPASAARSVDPPGAYRRPSSAIHRASQPNANARRPRRGGPGPRAGLQGLDWQSIDAQDWKAAFVKEAKQAESLVSESFPWTLVERIAVIDATRQAAVAAIVSGAAHAPPIQLRRDWY
ncbi:MAG: DUF4433 domain-containing protein [Acidobacteriaceae bacterium]|nr:DUF4433 domain-containing protein [Acidobacteriaceae bacterium]